MASLKLLRFGHYLEGTLSIFLSMENNRHCTISHHSSYMTILYPLEKESCMGSNVSLVPLLVMYSGDEKGRRCKYSKITAGSAQNNDFYCKKWSFALLLLTNPLSNTITSSFAIESGVVW
jgi:hypothetical protein